MSVITYNEPKGPESTKRELINYESTPGRYPFDHWIKNLGDLKGRSIILARLDRLQLFGHFGNHRVLGPGLIELKVNFGPGYRLYMGADGTTLIILLCGGDKKSQDNDIRTAEAYWHNYRQRKKNETLQCNTTRNSE